MNQIVQHWQQIEDWLHNNLPEVAADLRPPASDTAIAEFETRLGKTIPEDLKTLYKIHDGQRFQPPTSWHEGFHPCRF